MRLKITTIGNSAGVVLPKILLSRLRLSRGDTLYASDLPEGVTLLAHDPAFARQVRTGESVLRRRGALLSRLPAD